MGLLEPDGRGRRPFRRNGVGLRRDNEDTVQASDAPVIVIHSLTHAVAALRAALEAGRPIILASPPGAGIYAGPGWFREVLFAARAAAPAAQFTAVLDCGDNAGVAMAAVRAGFEAVVFTGRANVAARLADIAGQSGASLLRERPAPSLDLAAAFFASPDALRRSCLAVFDAE